MGQYGKHHINLKHQWFNWKVERTKSQQKSYETDWNASEILPKIYFSKLRRRARKKNFVSDLPEIYWVASH